MLSEAEIQRLLHASRVVPLDVPNPHGPLGIKQLAGAIALVRGEALPQRVERSISLSVETWAKLTALAHAHSSPEKPATPSELVAGLLEQLVEAHGKP
jgi:hypothetical protein